MAHLSQQFLNFFILSWAQSFCTTVKFGVVFLKSVGNNYEKFVSRIFDERITPENMHNKVCKMALGVHSKASNHAVKGELGRFPLHLIIYTRIFKYFLRLLTLQNNQILNSALEINIHLNNVSKHSWFTTVRHLLHFTKFNDYTPNLPHLDNRTFPQLVRMFKRNLFKEYQEYWSKSLNKDKFDSSVGNKLSLYNEVKNEVRFKSYLVLIKNVKTRVVLSPNGEEVASCKKHTQFKTRVDKPCLILDQNGRNCYPISDQNG